MTKVDEISILKAWVIMLGGWVVSLTTQDWISGFELLKNILGVVAFIVTITYTLYKFYHAKKRNG